MKKIQHIAFLIFITSLMLTSCEKEIDLDLPKTEEKIVIEGFIETDEYPWVFISKNHPYLEGIDLTSISQSTSFEDVLKELNKNIVLPSVFTIAGRVIDMKQLGFDLPDITITVSDGSLIDTLVFEINPLVYTGKGFVYPPARFIGKNIKGRMLGKYDLTIKYGDKTYTSTTTIPKYSAEDYSPTFVLDNMMGNNDNDSFGLIYLTLNDDPNEQNYYRFYTKIIGEDSLYNKVSGPGRILNDQMFNGKKFPFPIIKSRTTTAEEEETEDRATRNLFKVGEKVILKCCSMDHDHYWFWVTANRSGGSMVGGSPSKILGNIQGGALGIWGGYGVVYKEIDCIPTPATTP